MRYLLVPQVFFWSLFVDLNTYRLETGHVLVRREWSFFVFVFVLRARARTDEGRAWCERVSVAVWCRWVQSLRGEGEKRGGLGGCLLRYKLE